MSGYLVREHWQNTGQNSWIRFFWRRKYAALKVEKEEKEDKGERVAVAAEMAVGCAYLFWSVFSLGEESQKGGSSDG